MYDLLNKEINNITSNKNSIFFQLLYTLQPLDANKIHYSLLYKVNYS